MKDVVDQWTPSWRDLPTTDSAARSKQRSTGKEKSSRKTPVMPGEPLDPALIGATVMLRSALAEKSVRLTDLSAPGKIVLIQSPSADWNDLLCKAWQKLFKDRHRRRAAAPGFADIRESTWLADEDDEGKEQTPHPKMALIAQTRWRGSTVAGFSDRPNRLPLNLLAPGDIHLIVSPPTMRVAKAVARQLTGATPKRRILDTDASRLTPMTMRLARRPGQTADDYIDALARMLTDENMSGQPKRKGSTRDQMTLDCLHGMDEAVSVGRKLARDLAAYAAGQLPWADVDRGILLSGPPGCGKTLFARVLATSCGVPLMHGSYAMWHASGHAHQGDFLKAMAGAFAKARDQAPALLFIDEIDSFPDRGTLTHSHKDYMTQVVNALLAQIDGVEAGEGVVVLAACNHPHLLDPALVRSGRLERHIQIGLPDTAARACILREYLTSGFAETDLLSAAHAAEGATGADCARFVRGARNRARSIGREVNLDDLLAEIGGTEIRSERSLRVISVHEAGHAIAACLLRPGSLRSLSIRPNLLSEGRTTMAVETGEPTADELRITLTILLAGRAAEQEILGVVTGNAGGSANSDLAIATLLAARGIGCCGLAQENSLLWSGVIDAGSLPTIMACNPAIKASVHAMLAEAYLAARELLRLRHTAVEQLAALLRHSHFVEAQAVYALIECETDPTPHGVVASDISPLKGEADNPKLVLNRKMREKSPESTALVGPAGISK